jgi:RNA polymerase sigma-70 factor (ECF subfamily)
VDPQLPPAPHFNAKSQEFELLRLTHYVQLSQSEIAHRLGVPIGTIKSRVHRAHRRLAEQLSHIEAAP